jgi:hypothetical protein
MYEKYTFPESILHVQGAAYYMYRVQGQQEHQGHHYHHLNLGGHYFPQMGVKVRVRGATGLTASSTSASDLSESQPSKPPSDPLKGTPALCGFNASVVVTGSLVAGWEVLHVGTSPGCGLPFRLLLDDAPGV